MGRTTANTIRAAYKRGTETWLGDVDRLALPSDCVRIKVTACGICGTDLHQDPATASEAHTFGHEIAGDIIETGTAVSGWANGERVVLESASACGRCTNCRNGLQELCTDIRSFFYLNSFGMADEMIAPVESLIRCNDLSPAVACLSEPLAVAIDMVRLADIQPHSNVLLIGPGAIGLMAVALVKRMGAARIVVSGRKRNSPRLQLATKLGSDAVFDSAADIGEASGGAFDRILVTAPPPSLNTAFALASKGAIISFIGIGFGSAAFCNFDVNAFHFKKIQLRASFASPALYTPRALQYLRDGTIRGEDFISHQMPLSEVAAAMDIARDSSQSIKVVVCPEPFPIP